MKKVITIIGYPGAGKTTLSKFLAKKLHYNHFEFDKNNVLDINNDRVIFDALFLKRLFNEIIKIVYPKHKI